MPQEKRQFEKGTNWKQGAKLNTKKQFRLHKHLHSFDLILLHQALLTS